MDQNQLRHALSGSQLTHRSDCQLWLWTLSNLRSDRFTNCMLSAKYVISVTLQHLSEDYKEVFRFYSGVLLWSRFWSFSRLDKRKSSAAETSLLVVSGCMTISTEPRSAAV